MVSSDEYRNVIFFLCEASQKTGPPTRYEFNRIKNTDRLILVETLKKSLLHPFLNIDTFCMIAKELTQTRRTHGKVHTGIYIGVAIRAARFPFVYIYFFFVHAVAALRYLSSSYTHTLATFI